MFVYRHHSTILVLLLYVDDMLLTGNNSAIIQSFIATLSTQFAMKDLGDLHYFRGVQVVRTSSGLFLSQHKYVSDLLRKFHFHTLKSVRTPCVSRTTLSLTDGELLSDPSYYHCIVGALPYLTMTRPDIAYAVHVVSQFMHAPRSTHLHAVKRIFRYLQGTADHGLYFRSASRVDLLVAFCDSDWAGCPDTSRSTTRFAVFLGSNFISWRSKKQPTVSRSSTEAEYRAAAYTSAEIQWLRQLLLDLGILVQVPIRLFCDNISTTYLAANPVLLNRSKHIKVDYHFVRELVSRRHLQVKFIPTQSQVADIFTKGLSSQKFLQFKANLSVVSPRTD